MNSRSNGFLCDGYEGIVLKNNRHFNGWKSNLQLTSKIIKIPLKTFKIEGKSIFSVHSKFYHFVE